MYEKLEEICTYLKSKDISLVFVQSPCIKSEYEENKDMFDSHIEKCRSIVQANGFLFINGFNISDQFDDYTDFYNPQHMNESGAIKYTGYIVSKIQENGGIR